MKRKVDYILTSVGYLSKKDKLEDILSKVKSLNRYHFVTTPKGELINIKDVELNNEEDTNAFKVECIHLLILMPHPSAFNTIFYLIFRAYPLSRKMEALSKNFPNARVWDENQFYDDCLRKLELELIESEKNLLQSQRKLAQLESSLHELNRLGINDYHQN